MVDAGGDGKRDVKWKNQRAGEAKVTQSTLSDFDSIMKTAISPVKSLGQADSNKVKKGKMSHVGMGRKGSQRE